MAKLILFGENKEFNITRNSGKGIGSNVSSFSSGNKNTGEAVKKVGSPSEYHEIFADNDLAQAMLDFRANAIIKDGWFIRSIDDKAKEAVIDFLYPLPLSDITKTCFIDSEVYADGFIEITDNNLVNRDSRTMFVVAKPNSEIVGYEQKASIGSEPVKFEISEIARLQGNVIDNCRSRSVLEGTKEIFDLEKRLLYNISSIINLGSIYRQHYIIGAENEYPVNLESKKYKNMVSYLETLEAGQNIISNKEIKIQDISAKPSSSDIYTSYMEMIHKRICTKLKVPYSLWFEPRGGAAIEFSLEQFKQYTVLPDRKKIEQLFNTQIIPRILDISNIKTDELVEFRFGEIDINDEFTKTKVELVKQQTHIKTPNEARVEEGKSPIEGGDSEPTEITQIPIDNKGEIAKKNIGGNLTGSRGM